MSIPYECKHCLDPIDEKTFSHWIEGSQGNGYGHYGLCCDCMDLSCGQPLEDINAERAAKGKRPINAPFPGRDEHGLLIPTSE